MSQKLTETKIKEGKIIYLIRHGESKGQAAGSRGTPRTDPSLLDADLTRKGRNQANEIDSLLGEDVMSSIQLIVSSPLTRALNTALVGFKNRPQDCNIIVRYDIREVGSKIPENIPRPIKDVLKDLSYLPRTDELDYHTFKPEEWPPSNNVSCGSKKKKRVISHSRHTVNDSIRNFLLWLSQERAERTIAVVCHYNVIRSMLSPAIHPTNGIPIACQLNDNGELYVI